MMKTIFILTLAAISLLSFPAKAQKFAQQPFQQEKVKLTDGIVAERFELNAKRTFAIDYKDIVAPFLKAKGLDVQGNRLHSDEPSKTFTGHWPGLYEAFWMSGAAHIARWSGNPEHKATLLRIVDQMVLAAGDDGFLLALGRDYKTRWSHDDLYALIRVTIRAMLDIYETTQDERALRLAVGQMNSVLADITNPLSLGRGLVLRGMDKTKIPTSYYKLLPALAQLYYHTHDPRLIKVAEACIDTVFFKHLEDGDEDPLPGLHASTWTDHLMGLNLMGEYTGNENWQLVTEAAAKVIRDQHLFITGSFSSYEHFQSGAGNWQLRGTLRTEETCCGAIWLTFLQALLRTSDDPAHIDCMEKVIYNNLLVSQSAETGDFCYFVNLIGVDKPHDAPPQFGRHCCEGTGLMSIGRIPGLIYGKTENGFAINLYIPSRAEDKTKDGTPVSFEIKTGYPYSGEVKISVNPAKPSRFLLQLHKPEWAPKMEVLVNGKAIDNTKNQIDRVWEKGDEVLLRMPMEPVFKVRHFDGITSAALTRGPLVYAATWEDSLPYIAKFNPGYLPLSSSSHFEKWPYAPSIFASWPLPASVEPGKDFTFSAEGISPFLEGSEKPKSINLKFVPFLNTIKGKYAIWLPLEWGRSTQTK